MYTIMVKSMPQKVCLEVKSQIGSNLRIKAIFKSTQQSFRQGQAYVVKFGSRSNLYSRKYDSRPNMAECMTHVKSMYTEK